MYYILNHTDQIIAADNQLLELLHLESIDELTKQIILGDIDFTTLTQESIRFITQSETIIFTTHTSSLSSLLGDLRLVQLITQDEEKEDFSTLTLNDNDSPRLSSIDEEDKQEVLDKDITPSIKDIDDLISIENSSEDLDFEILDDLKEAPSETEAFTLLDDSDISDKSPTLATTDEESIDNDVLFDLTIPNEPEVAIDEISLDETTIPEVEVPATEKEEVFQDKPEEIDTTPIIIHIDEVSENIGISQEDYKTFLNEYIDTAISLESDLQSANTDTRNTAISTLIQLADVLELPSVNNIISNLKDPSTYENTNNIEIFYQTLARLTTQTKDIAAVDILTLEEPSIIKEEIIDQKSSIQKENDTAGFGTLNLEGIHPIHFDFQLEEAANDLSLPVELIEEFVHDFIDQAHTETEKMLSAYEKGDLDAIQKIGHMLKGASSNLRINALSDTLYNIQFCEDSSQLEDFIKQYWGHFLSFEQQINALSN